ncbi:Type II secretion system (T2SS), protein F [Nakamurella panacisegetis]|uniref:Type II secretion system (T2SS), protein F n=1 Tax=Nakamurella panacisegetis TaxID=1090615 RepID=A0A1H0N9R8_9ACTN|nr:type II secretion system F family protein [Nakamurella panacisegetis]SDO89437.1 Type II secretion system (T2SS), protein F [Nakamurella panacisegetis]
MNGAQSAAICLTGLGFLVIPGPLPFGSAPRLGRTGWSPRSRRAVVVGIGVLAASVVTAWWPWWIALILALAAGAVSLQAPERRSPARRTGDRQRLAVHADLLAACLESGMAIGAALKAISSVLRALDEPDPDDPLLVLDSVSALLALGADPERAWDAADAHPDLVGLAAAARRSAAGGTTFADAVREHAAILRRAVGDAAERSAGRAGVAMTAPLGLCFLPAFLCLGLAPVVVGLLGSLHLF